VRRIFKKTLGPLFVIRGDRSQAIDRPAVVNGVVYIGSNNGAIYAVGTVQLDFAIPPNQPHRAEIKKLLVHPDARRRGIAKSLMCEAEARKARRSLLTLDTVTGGNAEQLYFALGCVAVGSIPRYALNFNSSVLEAATVMYKELF
jgi:ribosomal protein S18 acetylase RimI-like enzyme